MRCRGCLRGVDFVSGFRSAGPRRRAQYLVSQVKRGDATLEHLLTGALAFVESSHSSATKTAGRVERPDVVGVLSQLASAARLLRSADGRYCAQVPVGDRLEIYGLTSAGNSDTRKLVGRSANERTRGWQPRERAAGKAAGEKKLGEKQRAVAVDLYRQMKHTIDETARRLASRGQRFTSMLRRLALSDIGSKHVTILFRCGIPSGPRGPWCSRSRAEDRRALRSDPWQ